MGYLLHTVNAARPTFARVIGSALRKAREEAGLTQEAVAARAGMDRAYVSMVERDKSSPTVVRLFRMCKAIGVKPSTILARVERALSRR